MNLSFLWTCFESPMYELSFFMNFFIGPLRVHNDRILRYFYLYFESVMARGLQYIRKKQ